MTRLTFLLVTMMLILTACSTTEKLKNPCEDPGIFSYVDDCGPLMPVNESFDEVLVKP